jgi:hypothetical protein
LENHSNSSAADKTEYGYRQQSGLEANLKNLKSLKDLKKQR